MRSFIHEYNQHLSTVGYSFFQSIDCIYYEQFIDKKLAALEAAEQRKWGSKSFIKRLLLSVIPKSLFISLQSNIQKIINAYPYSAAHQLVAEGRTREL